MKGSSVLELESVPRFIPIASLDAFACVAASVMTTSPAPELVVAAVFEVAGDEAAAETVEEDEELGPDCE